MYVLELSYCRFGRSTVLYSVTAHRLCVHYYRIRSWFIGISLYSGTGCRYFFPSNEDSMGDKWCSTCVSSDWKRNLFTCLREEVSTSGIISRRSNKYCAHVDKFPVDAHARAQALYSEVIDRDRNNSSSHTVP